MPNYDESGHAPLPPHGGSNEWSRDDSESLVRTLCHAVEQTADIVVVTDREGRIEYVNPAFERVSGYTRREVLGLNPRILKSGRHDPEFYAQWWRTILSGSAFHALVTNLKKDGSLFVEEKTISPLRDAAGTITHFVSTGKDVTERMKESEELRRNTALVQAIFEGAEDAIFIADDSGRYVDVNPAACRLTGYSREELVGLDSARLTPPSHLDEAKKLREEFFRKGTLRGEFPRLRKDGAIVLCDYHAVANILPGLHLSIMRDITEKKKLEDQVMHAQKMDSIGRLAGGIAHDFNNLVTIIQGRCYFLLNGKQDPKFQHDGIVEIKRASERAAALTRQLLAFSRREPLRLEVFCLNDVVDGMKSMLSRLIEEDIALVFNLAEGLDFIRADRGQLEQVLMNLVVNARDALPKGGTIAIETANACFGNSASGLPRDGAADGGVALIVRDTGIGMDDETRARIFEPFFTTKAKGKGTGLGLAIVYGVVHQCGGNISVQSAPGKGSVFSICLPAEKNPTPSEGSASGSSARAPAVPCTETLLVVEDEAWVLDLIEEILSPLGYTVLPALGPETAMRMSEAHAGRIDLLLTDVVMPGISGAGLAAQLAASRPKMKVLFVSGYTSDAIAQYGVLEPGKCLLEKPFTPHMLRTRVRELLDAMF